MKPFGLGDLAYYAFRPVVYLIDLTWGTDLRDCDKCKERRRLWNSWFSVPRRTAIAVAVIIALILTVRIF